MKAEEIMRALQLTAMGRVNTPEQHRLCEALEKLMETPEQRAGREMAGANVWMGNYGEYQIPNDLYAILKLNKDGLPDQRWKGNAPFWAWVSEQEAAAKAAQGL